VATITCSQSRSFSRSLRPWPGSERYIDAEVDSAGYYRAEPTTAYGVIPMLTASTDLGRDDLVLALGSTCPTPSAAASRPRAPRGST